MRSPCAGGACAPDSRARRRWAPAPASLAPAPQPAARGARPDFSRAQAPQLRWSPRHNADGVRRWQALVVGGGGPVRRPPGSARWSLSRTPSSPTRRCATLASLPEARPGPLLHSDRGCHYQWPGWISITRRRRRRPLSVRKGHSRTTPPAEAFFRRAKVGYATAATGAPPRRLGRRPGRLRRLVQLRGASKSWPGRAARPPLLRDDRRQAQEAGPGRVTVIECPRKLPHPRTPILRKDLPDLRAAQKRPAATCPFRPAKLGRPEPPPGRQDRSPGPASFSPTPEPLVPA